MNFPRFVVAVAVLSLGLGACAEILVDGNLPAGNVIFDGVEGETVYVRQDQSTTDRSGWFYWAFRVRGAAGRTLTFDFKKGYPTSVGPRGPVVTLDRGKTYSYPCDKDGAAMHPKNAFTYAFPADADEVWFYECIPYQQAQWDAFLARHAAKRGRWFETGVLCKSKKGRDVERARFGCIGKKAKWRMMTTCRHHCSESVASYVNEGLCAAFLGEDELGAWLRENVELMTIPFIDKDGVEDGDQGKNRPPHDHNRDYGAFVYPETKAMTEWAREHAGNDIAIYLDLHCPWIRGEPTNERLYTPFKASKWYRDPAFEKADRRFSQTLERVQCGSFRYKASDDLDYGRFWNTGANYAKGGPSTLWGLTHFTGPVSRCVEIPFQNANGAVVTRETCRDLGRDLAKAVRAFLLDEEARRGRETKITFLGDVMCHGAMLEAYRTGKTFDFSEVFAGVIPLLSQSDLVCANIETPLAEDNGDLTREKWRFNSPRQFAQAAKAAGIDIAFTANNHCLDRGLKGVAATLRVLDGYGFRHTGTFADRASAETPLFVEVNGFKIGLLSYTYGSNAWSNREYLRDEDLWHVNFFQRQEANEPAAQAWLKNRNSSEGRAYAEMEAKRRPENLRLPWYERTEDHARERERLAADVARMRKGDPDLVVMSMHAGGQYNPEATAKTKELAEFLLKSGVDVIAGSHEHVVHGSDFSRLAENKLVAYSLGDFDCLHGTWVKPPNPTKGLYPDYSIAWHVYLTRDADGKAKVSRTDFDVLKIVKGEKNGRIRVKLAKDVPGTEADVAAVSRRFAGNPAPECVDGIYPHLAMFNREGECGTGAVVPWAGSLWAITYGPHCPVGSSDKLYQITPDLKQIVRPESVGGTPANRLIHRETNQLLIGPYVIDAQGGVRTVPVNAMPGRLTGAARHLTDPANKVYVATMETGLYELDMRTLAVNTLIRENGKNDWAIRKIMTGGWPTGWSTASRTHVPGYHAKGLCSGFGRVFVANNGEDSEAARKNPFVPSGVLAQWSSKGEDWKTIRRCQFTEITTADGIYGNEHPESNPVWALGWDAKSVILAVNERNVWKYYRMPKGSHSYDGAHGWNTEWPRIRDVGFGDGTLLGTMHGTFWKFPKSFSHANPGGIRPISTYLKVIGDFCWWKDAPGGGSIVFGCDDQAQNEFLGKRTLKKNAPKRDRSQSNLWFMKHEELASFGPPSGEGWVWLDEDVKAGDVSDPYLHAGYETMEFSFTDAEGACVPHELLEEGDWVRVKALRDAKGANAHFVYGPKRPLSLPKYNGFIEVYDDFSKKTYRFPNVNGDKTVVCREVATERDLLYVGGVFYELPADNAGGFEVLRPIALADEPVRSIEAKLGLVYVNGRPMALDRLWKNGTAAAAYWLWRSCCPKVLQGQTPREGCEQGRRTGVTASRRAH